jgi:hypothetical protein
MKRSVKFILGGAAAVAVASASWLGAAVAADHNDPPARIGGLVNSADIADLYAWHSEDAQTLKIVLTFAGPAVPAAGQAGAYDADVLYAINIDNSGDNVANTTIYVRYGQNDLRDFGVQVVGLPGEAGPISGAVETTLTGTTAKVWTGLRDDPFFFDLQGFEDTLLLGTLSFDDTRDSFAGRNVTALVIEVPVAAAIGGGSNLSIWATTSRI